jgi:hypothetical protein
VVATTPRPTPAPAAHFRQDELLAAIQRLRDENAKLREQNNQLRRSLQSYLLKGHSGGLYARAG